MGMGCTGTASFNWMVDWVKAVGTDGIGQLRPNTLIRPNFIPEFFDSLGSSAEVVKSRLGKKKVYYYNSSPVQPESSTLCGYYCIYWIEARLYNADLKFSEVSTVAVCHTVFAKLTFSGIELLFYVQFAKKRRHY
jgi:hypothetical protein